ncbi:MAG: cytochrome c3 family protein [Bacteroidetes bacterium]|nr:cytochrome c3 family protein [Bacteroidota bacterium]
MLPQIKRLGLAFAIFICLFLVARHLLVPKTFGDKGHFRAASIEDNAAMPMKYAGKEGCIGCHDDMIEKKAASPHAKINCETCHGPCLQHTLAPDTVKPLKPKGREFCGKCHSRNIARSTKNIVQIDLKEHNPEQICTECHNPHDPWENLK